MSKQKFHTAIVGGETKDVAGIEVPPAIIAALGAGQRPRVAIEVNGYCYTSTIGKMGGKHLIPLSAEHRRASGLSVCDDVEVHISVAGAEPVADTPSDLAKAMKKAGTTAAFDTAAPSKRKEWIRQVLDAKSDETRNRRIEKIIATLQQLS